MAGSAALQTHLCHAVPPWSTLLVVPQGGSTSALVKTPPGFVTRTIQGRKCRTASNLFGEFARALAFPEYFGHNWDAFYDCLADLSEHHRGGLVIVFDDLSGFARAEAEEFAAAVDSLRDAVECFWTSPLDALAIGSFLLTKGPLE